MFWFACGYLLGSFLIALLISYEIEDELYGDQVLAILNINTSRPLYETVRIMLTGPLMVWFAI